MKRYVWLAVLMTLGAESKAQGDEAAVVARILMRAATFDRSLKARPEAKLTAAIVFRAGDPASVREKDKLKKELGVLAESMQLSGKAWEVIELRYESRAALATAVVGGGVDILVLTGGMKDQLAEITQLTREKKLMSLTTTREGVTSGVSIGVAVEQGKPKLFVNLEASKAEAMDLSGQILQMAEIIR